MDHHFFSFTISVVFNVLGPDSLSFNGLNSLRAPLSSKFARFIIDSIFSSIGDKTAKLRFKLFTLKDPFKLTGVLPGVISDSDVYSPVESFFDVVGVVSKVDLDLLMAILG